MKIKKLGALLVSAALCAGMAAPAFAFEGDSTPVEQPVLPEIVEEEDTVTITDEETGALTPEGNLTLVDDYYTNYSDGSGQQFITLVSKSGATFYLVIDRNAKGQQTVHFMNLVDEADLLALMEEDAADAYTAEKEAAAQAEQDKLKAEEEAKKAAEEAAASGTEQPTENKVTKIASGFLGVVVLIQQAAASTLSQSRSRKSRPKKKPLTPMQTTPRTRAILRFPPMCRTRTEPRTSRTPNPSDFKAAFCRRTYCNQKQIGGIFIAKLVVAEKPSVAMSYAKVLGATSRQDGYLEGNGYLVSWCVGHLVELAPPNIYDAKYVKWSIADLPILPQKWQYLVSTSTKKQFGILQKLMNRPDVDGIVNSCDAGQCGWVT